MSLLLDAADVDYAHACLGVRPREVRVYLQPGAGLAITSDASRCAGCLNSVAGTFDERIDLQDFADALDAAARDVYHRRRELAQGRTA